MTSYFQVEVELIKNFINLFASNGLIIICTSLPIYKYYFPIYPKNITQMLSQSMVKKFAKKIQQLIIHNQDQVQQINPRQMAKKHQDISDSEYQVKNMEEDDENEELSASELLQNQKLETQRRNTARLTNEENQKAQQIDMKSERIHPKELSKLIEIQKQKSRMAKLNSESDREKNLIHQNQAIKQNIVMPKLATMNNLVKLSTRLPLIDFLELVKYKATQISMAPIRLLFYWCIQRILYQMYAYHGVEEMNLRKRDIQFLESEIKNSLVGLIGYVKITQRTMISRVLRAVFNRIGYPHVYSQQWLTNCLKQKRSFFQAMKLPIEQLLKPPISNNISSKIFNGIPLAGENPGFNYLDFNLEDEAQENERIEVFHPQQKVFFQKNSKINGDRYIKGKDKEKRNQNRLDKQVFSDDDANFEQSQFQIQVQKLHLPSNSIVYSSPEANDFDQAKKKKGKIVRVKKPEQISFDEEQVGPVKRNNYIFNREAKEESKQSRNYLKQYTDELLTKEKISELVEQYLSDNMQQLANRIASKLTITFKKTNEPKRSKMKSTISFSKQKQKSESEILKEMDERSKQLERIGINDKDLVKQMLKLLQGKSLTKDRKQQLMDKWILLKQRSK